MGIWRGKGEGLRKVTGVQAMYYFYNCTIFCVNESGSEWFGCSNGARVINRGVG